MLEESFLGAMERALGENLEFGEREGSLVHFDGGGQTEGLGSGFCTGSGWRFQKGRGQVEGIPGQGRKNCKLF